ncbi:type I restriction endonuclease subunit R, EcoR124 family [[Ruminococcus] lactaris]|uniref:type I restriction endonuclease subunit R, EcoR124 family n=1 Tax=[Ruminococcus] lactaris TaxID=46228 RepID=UPI00299F863D|nr:HsdR family type I site-specific deoxyribonuclease [[Ruminococcus] lactaris]
MVDLVDRVTRKNQDLVSELPLTISAQYGLIDQNEFFDKRVASKDVSGYYLIENGEFAYNKSTSTDAPWGAIKRLDRYKNGVLSTLYIVFGIKENNPVDSDFLVSYYSTNLWHKGIHEIAAEGARNHGLLNIAPADFFETKLMIPQDIEEQKKIGKYFEELERLITLHHRKYMKYADLSVFDWEQRKLVDLVDRVTRKNQDLVSELPLTISAQYGLIDQNEFFDKRVASKDVSGYYLIENGEFAYNKSTSTDAPWGAIKRLDRYKNGVLSTLYIVFGIKENNPVDSDFLVSYYSTNLWHKGIHEIAAEGARNHGLLNIAPADFFETKLMIPQDIEEQKKIGKYFEELERLITLHHRKQNYVLNTLIYAKTTLFITKEKKKMPELEKVIEDKLIEQLVFGESQWTYREDLKTEEELWQNFRYILEQNNKARLDGQPLSDAEFEQVKNQLQFSSFYKAGEWLVGENGKAMVHVQRDTEKLHLVVMNHEHIAGGSSVYEVINQYNALKDDDITTVTRDRRFDVTLMINGLPMIHIELKNRQHSYMEAFYQIKKYISEGKFTGIFSAVQMFVISNGVDTKYFAAASDTELNPKFMSGWVDTENNPVADYIDFAKNVLRIPEAHEMIARYTVLDEDAKRLILLRPYQIHAIESIREASKTGKSGFVWHTTGSGKTLTSYKATRNLLMDIPAIDKAIFLIDRKDLDTQTTMAFQAYANNDLVDVDETDNVNDLKKKLKSDDRQVIVTTIQKMQILISKRLQEGTSEYNKIKNLKIAFVVDECHRAVTPKTKRELERFFGRSLWYGFTGTPRFAENPYPQMGDLPRTTEELYGKRLHKYTIQNAIHDNAVLGFQVEHNGPKNITDETDASAYDNETHMLRVLDIILNKSYYKLGFQNGKGQTYEGLLTTSSIQIAQKYYELLTKVKNGETSLEIDEKIKQVLPDFPKFAITYSVTENEEGSHVNQEKMQKSLDDYNQMFGTKYELSQIQGYNGNLNKRLARKDAKFKSRSEQLDLVIVVDRLLTGFDAPCMSTIFIDRQPMGPHDLIQAFSRTNRIFDKNKTYGQIVTFQAPKLFKESVDNAVKLYSAGSTGTAILAEWEEIEPAFRKSLAALRVSAETPEEVTPMSIKEKKVFVKMFQTFDRLFAQLKSFTQYDDSMLEEYGITEEEYDKYAGVYKNAVEEIKIAEGGDDSGNEPPEDETIDVDYELMAYSSTKIDYEYIINLIQNIVTPDEDAEAISPEERQKQIDEVKQYIDEMRKDNPKVAEIMTNLVSEIEEDENKYKGQSILNIVENMKRDCIEKVISDFCVTWYASKEDVMYAALHYRNGEIPNESVIKATIDYQSYKSVQEKALPKFKYYAKCMAELKKTLDEEIKPLISVA